MVKKNLNSSQKIHSPPPPENSPAVNQDGIEEFKKQIEKLEKEKDDYLKGWQQERADVLNYKRREEERMDGAIKFANQSLLKELIRFYFFQFGIFAKRRKCQIKKLGNNA
jgi:molecular chaperone GrpE (heat shock protein)